MKANQGDYTLVINGKKIKFKDEDPIPRISDKGLPMLSTELLTARLGVQHALVEGTIRMSVGSKTLVAKIGDINMTFDGASVRADGMPFIVAGRMYLPAVQVCTLLGLKATYDEASKTLNVSK